MDTQAKKETDSGKVFLLTESNVIDVIKKLDNKEVVDPAEIEQIKKRFYELLTYQC